METIDFSRYEGHTPGPWYTKPDDYALVNENLDTGEKTYLDIRHLYVHASTRFSVCEVHMERKEYAANANLIADAPLLLAEVKRLQDENQRVHACNVRQCETISGLQDQLGQLRAELDVRFEQGYNAGQVDANAGTGTDALQRLADELTVKIDHYEAHLPTTPDSARVQVRVRIAAMEDVRECIKRALRKGGAK
jgi:hypothetical protein